MALLARAMIAALAHPRQWWGNFLIETQRQILGTLPLATFLSALGGAVTSQQSGYQFSGDLPLWVIGTVVSASVITELAPLMTGIALLGVVGARIAAELASMKVSEQIDALEVIGRDPASYLGLPRVLAGLVAGPVLCAFALVAGMLAGWMLALWVTPITHADFWHGVRFFIRDFALIFPMIKAILFGFSATAIPVYIGLSARGGSEGVGRATTIAVVAMLSALLVIDVAVAPLLKIIRL